MEGKDPTQNKKFMWLIIQNVILTRQLDQKELAWG
jgi:hypothetical protein